MTAGAWTSHPLFAAAGTWRTECAGPLGLRACCSSRGAFRDFRSLLRVPVNLSSHRARPTCAIVGASGTLLHSRHGRDIDSHDVVLRMNRAPTHNFERHVGRKTTARVLQMDAFAFDPRYGAAVRSSPLKQYGVPRLVSCHPPFNGRCTLQRMQQIFFNTTAGRAHLLSADVARAASRRFVGVRQRSVTTGMLAIEAALRMRCDVVRLYGFADGMCPRTCYHYYEHPCRFTEEHFFDRSLRATAGFHDFTQQANVLHTLNRSRAIVWVAPSC